MIDGRETLTADDLDSHARVSMPLDGVELDVASQHGVVQVVVLHRVRVHVTFEHLLARNPVRLKVKMLHDIALRRKFTHPLQSVLDVTCHVGSHSIATRHR